MVKKKSKALILKFLFFVIFQGLFIGIARILLKRVGAFGCFDDCFNFGAGDFILQGKQLYSQIFFNHQPFMAYISAAIQFVTHPTTLFALVKYHRIAVFVFADVCGSFLIFRFGFPVFMSLIIFELTKFYIFGDRFLAEGLIVYPMIYLAVLLVSQVKKQKMYSWEYVLAAISAWFIFWMREPFMPWSFVALGILIIVGFNEKRNRKPIWVGLCVFVVLHLTMLVSLPIKEYIFNVIVTNLQQEVTVQPWTGSTIAQIIFYPVFILLGGFGTLFQNVLWILSGLFCLCIVYELWKKRFGVVLVQLILLAFANFRVVPVGSLYYDAFHMIPWYGIFVTSIAMCMFDMAQSKKKNTYTIFVACIFVFVIGYTIISPQSYIHESIDTQTEFNNGYGNYFAKGEVIRLLSKPGDTMFVEMWEDPIYFVAGVPTAYTYSWYTSIMPKFQIYRQARDEMFAVNPPTFYAGACKNDDVESSFLSAKDKEQYVQLLNSGKPSCIYVSNSILPRISSDVSARIKIYGYSLP